jgi:SAM-dependent methyltransferase
MYLQAMQAQSGPAFGVDIDVRRAAQARGSLPNIVTAPAEQLPFAQGSFDVVLLHEVIEHVDDDRRAIREAYRVLVPGGRMIIFAPNRLYPMETHGVFWRGRYHFGNIPVVNWLPDPLRDRLAPHVRAYTGRRLLRLLNGLRAKIVVHAQIYPGYDKIVARWAALGQALRWVTYILESTPLKSFGLSHFLVAEKEEDAKGA